MQFVIFGAGAIGGVVGARLTLANEDVVLIARGDHARAMQRDGLLLRTPDETHRVPVRVCDDPVDLALRHDSVVMLAVKSQDTEAALDALRPAINEATPIVCLQNGVENERRVARRHRNVYGAVVMCPAAHLEPGEVLAYSAPINALIDVGCYPNGTDDTTAALAETFKRAGIDALERHDIMRWKYTKLLMNLANAVDALCRPSDASRQLTEQLRGEGRAVLRKAGIDFATEAEDAARRGDLISRRAIDDGAHPGSSSWQSLRRSTGSIETDFLNGEIALLGNLHGIDTPLNRRVADAAAAAARDRLPPGTLDARELLVQRPSTRSPGARPN